jgi:hypothetical protein
VGEPRLEPAPQKQQVACAVAGHDDDHRIPKTEVAVGDYAAILSLLVARKATCLLALILIASPVAGLRPLRAARACALAGCRASAVTKSFLLMLTSASAVAAAVVPMG